MYASQTNMANPRRNFSHSAIPKHSYKDTYFPPAAFSKHEIVPGELYKADSKQKPTSNPFTAHAGLSLFDFPTFFAH